MATLNEEPQNHLFEQSTEHIVKQNIPEVNTNHVKEDSDCDRELFQSSINNPIIIQNQLTQNSQNQNDQTGQQQQNEVIIEEVLQDTLQEESSQAKQDGQQTNQNSQQQSQPQANNQEEIQRFAQIFGVANAIKEQAKVCVQKKQYKDAIKLYENSLQVINISNFQLGTDKSKYKNILKEQVELTLMLLCNISLCYFNEGDFEKSLEYVEKVRIINPNHLKASYRRALALKKLQRYEKAFEEIKNARLIAIGHQQVDENINKEYKVIKQLYTEGKSKIESQNNSAHQLSSSGTNNKSKKSQNLLNDSSLTNVSQFLDNNFPGSMKTTPFYMLCSSFTTYVVLKKFMNIRLLSKPAIIGGPLLSLGLFGFLQGKNIFIKLLCGGLVGLIGSFLYRYSDLISSKQLTLL
ncbi:hypothetical protein ABPG72_017174 [Tetrahymena utriculariae]